MRNPSLLFILSYLPIAALAQHRSPSQARTDLITLDRQPGKRIDIISLPGVRRYKGNVRLRQQNTLLFCDRANHQLATNTVTAAGHVLLVEHDSITVKSDSLFYDVPGQQVILTGHVQLQNGRSVLTATQLNYDLHTGTAYYKGKGRLANGRSIQTIPDGIYDVRTKHLAVNSTNSNQPRGNMHDRLVATDASPTQPTTQLQEEARPIRLTMSPQPNNIVTKPESVSTYKRQVRVSQRPLQTAIGPREQVSDESELEHLLNQKKRVF